jgi:hypothetical protein
MVCCLAGIAWVPPAIKKDGIVGLAVAGEKLKHRVGHTEKTVRDLIQQFRHIARLIFHPKAIEESVLNQDRAPIPTVISSNFRIRKTHNANRVVKWKILSISQTSTERQRIGNHQAIFPNCFYAIIRQ